MSWCLRTGRVGVEYVVVFVEYVFREAVLRSERELVVEYVELEELLFLTLRWEEGMLMKGVEWLIVTRDMEIPDSVWKGGAMQST